MQSETKLNLNKIPKRDTFPNNFDHNEKNNEND